MSITKRSAADFAEKLSWISSTYNDLAGPNTTLYNLIPALDHYCGLVRDHRFLIPGFKRYGLRDMVKSIFSGVTSWIRVAEAINNVLRPRERKITRC